MGSDNFKKLSDVTRIIVLCSFVGLLSLLAAQSSVQDSEYPLWAARLLPLLIFSPGLVYANVRTHILLCFVCLLYFLIFVQNIFANINTVWSILGLVELVVLFVSAMMFARWRSKSMAVG